MTKTFGEMIAEARKQKEWTVRMFIQALEEDISPSYITKIEVHGEIPNPELICKMAQVLNLSQDDLLQAAKGEKVHVFTDALEKKYLKAAGLFKIQKDTKRG